MKRNTTNQFDLELANFIVSFGSMNDYSSTVLQTKRALDLNDITKLNKNSDAGILYDAVDGIEAAKKYGFSTDGIIAINKTFVHSPDEDPKLPGHLRNSKYYHPDDEVVIITDPHGSAKDAYFAPADVTRKDLDEIVEEYNKSSRTVKDAWRVFAQISKLQPFQDGNKRTALISANAAKDTWSSQEYLTLPFNNIDHADFMVNLIRFYIATDKNKEELALDRMVSVLPSSGEVQSHLHDLQTSENSNQKDVNKLKTKRFKSFYKK